MLHAFVAIASVLGVIWLLVISANFRRAFGIFVAIAVALVGTAMWIEQHNKSRNWARIAACRDANRPGELITDPIDKSQSLVCERPSPYDTWSYRQVAGRPAGPDPFIDLYKK